MSEEAPVAISGFDFFLPLPYRVVILINVGLLLWHLNLLTCRKFRIGILSVLRIPPQELTLSRLIGRSRICLINVTLSNFANYSIYYFFASYGFEFFLIDWLPLFSIVSTFMILLHNKSSFESQRLSQTIKRVIKGDIDISMRNNDILLTDTFTSYNKVLVDFLVYISALMLGMPALPSGADLTKELSKSHLQVYNIDLLLANFPSLLRLKQCLKEYNQSGRQNIRHLFNAIKYSTAFLPTISMILFKAGFLKTRSLWYFFLFVNSSYSLYWDITNDWNFGFFLKFLSDKPNVKLLRNKLLYSKEAYMLAMIIDFQLRFIWVYSLIFVNTSTPQSGKTAEIFTALFSTEKGGFILECLEIFRRWVWVFLKIETEYVLMSSASDFIELQSFD